MRDLHRATVFVIPRARDAASVSGALCGASAARALCGALVIRALCVFSGVALSPLAAAALEPAAVRGAALLQSSKPEEVARGIEQLRASKSPEAAVPLIRRIRAGLPPDLLDQSLSALTALNQPEAKALYYELLSHRRPEIRVRAIEAIAALHPSDAEPRLQRALGDNQPAVRSAAARALAAIGAPNSVDILFRALDRGTLEAPLALGSSLRSDQVPRLLNYLGKVPFEPLSPAFTQILSRKDITERAKLDVVAQLRDLATPDVKEYLKLLLHKSQRSLPEAVQSAVSRAIKQIAD